MEPAIAEKITVIWIGGSVPAGGWEFNQKNDLNAARVLFQSNLPLWQVPAEVYSTMKVSFFELIHHVYPYGEIGRYLVENTMRVNRILSAKLPGRKKPWEPAADAYTSFAGELWSLGDSPCVGLMLNHTLGRFHTADAPCDIREDGSYNFSRPGSRRIRIYDSIDSRFILNDMFEKIKYYFS